MNRTAQAEPRPLSVNPAIRLLELCRRLASAIALVSFLPALWAVFSPATLPGKPGWPDAVLLLATATATLWSLSRQLPGQNVILAATVIGVIGGIAHGIGAVTAIPFGPFTYADTAGPRFFGVLAWPMPVIWIVAVLNSRGVARLILRPWRKLRNYGFWLIGITAILTVLFDAALEPFATLAKHFWLWHETKFPLTWHGAPLVNFLGWLLTVLLILAFATPALINKRLRSKQSPPDYHPLVVWLLAMALFAAGAARHQLWPALIFCLVAGAVVTIFALRGARW